MALLVLDVVCLACFTTFRRAFFTLLLVVIVIGGILWGVFTATEAAAISVVYSFILSVLVYREINLSELPSILLESGVTTAVVILLIGASSGMRWIMTMANIPQTVSAALLDVSDNPLVILLLINLLLLLVGTFMDMTPTMLPLFGAMTLALMVITYVPSVSLWLPVQTKQLKEADVEKAFFMREKP